jgi:hypothetical protein
MLDLARLLLRELSKSEEQATSKPPKWATAISFRSLEELAGIWRNNCSEIATHGQ